DESLATSGSLGRNRNEKGRGVYHARNKVQGVDGHLWPRILPARLVQSERPVLLFGRRVLSLPGWRQSGRNRVREWRPPVLHVEAIDDGNNPLLAVSIVDLVITDLRAFGAVPSCSVEKMNLPALSIYPDSLHVLWVLLNKIGLHAAGNL